MDSYNNPPLPQPGKIAIRFASGLLVGALIVSSFFIGYIAGQNGAIPLLSGPQAAMPPEARSEFAPLLEIWNLLHEHYIDQPLDDTALVEGAIRGMLAVLGDHNTAYMTPEEYAILSSDHSGDLEGIGATVDVTGDYIEIIAPLSGSPAEEAGLLPGDLVIEVDGVDIFGMDPYDALSLVRGPAGTTVELMIRREGEPELLRFEITRYKIVIPQAEGEMLDDGIAYVRVNQFGDNAADELEAALQELLAEDPVGIVLDLRSNPGGSLNAAIRIGSQFTDQAPLMYEEFGDGSREPFDPVEGGMALDLPLVVLVNQGSASASEVLAAAIQDHERGLIVGELTFGKGTVQTWQPLHSNGGAVRITIARWLTPNGNWIEENGVTPDVVVEMTNEDFIAGLDPQLDTAIELLTEPVTAGQ